MRHSPEKCKDGGKHIWRKNDPGFLLTNCDENDKTVSFQGICKRCGCEDIFVPWDEYKAEDDNRENIEVYPHELRDKKLCTAKGCHNYGFPHCPAHC